MLIGAPFGVWLMPLGRRYGEDPLLTRDLAVEVVRGIQGTDPRYLKVGAAPKHFTVYDGPESNQPGSGGSGRMSFNADVSPDDLDQTWLDHWEAVVRRSGVHPLSGLMCSYSALNGVPMCGNRKMLTDKLRYGSAWPGHQHFSILFL